MDKFLLCALGLFSVTVICCLMALFSAQWVVSNFAGKTYSRDSKATLVPWASLSSISIQ